MRRPSARVGAPALVAGLLLALGGCGEDSTGPSTLARDGHLVFVDVPPDVLVRRTLPPLRVQLHGPDGRRAPYVSGPIEIRLSGSSAATGLTGRRFYDLVAGEALLYDLAVGEPAADLRLSATWNEVVGESPPFAVVEDWDAVRLGGDPVEAAVYVEGVDNRERPVWAVGRVEDGIARAGLLRPAPDPGANRVLAFAEERAPALAAEVAWTAGVDTVDLAPEAPTPIHLTVWMLDGSLELFEPLVFDGFIESEELWIRERAGLVIGLVEIVDARDDPDVPHLLTRDATAEWMEDLKRRIGERPGRINVYAVPKVRRDGRTFTGVAELGGNAIALSPGGWSNGTLAHEIGHNLGLGHVDGLEGFDDTNLMWSRGGRRAYVSEGQIARMHFAPSSALTGLLGSGAAGGVESSPVVAEETLPPLTLRLWPDGELPPTSATVRAARPEVDGPGRVAPPDPAHPGLPLGRVVVPAPAAGPSPDGAECLVLDPAGG